jgi:syntaxin 1B/2/3
MNPYAQQDNRYDPPQQGGYDRPQGGHQDTGYSSRFGDEEQGHGSSENGYLRRLLFNIYETEMQALNGQSSGRDPNAILNECRDIDKGIDRIQGNLDQLRRIQDVSVRDTNTDPKSTTNRDLDALNADTITLYRSFVSRMKVIKSNPESGNPRNSAQVGRVDRRLKEMINAYQQVERDYRKKVQESRERSYRIVRPDASDAEVREAMEEPANSQIFSQAVGLPVF